MALSPAKVPVARVIWVMLGHMGHVGQMGQMGRLGDVGQMSHVGQMGRMGHLGHLGRLGQMDHLGKDKPYDEEKMAHCISTSFACAVKFRILKAVSTKC